MCTYKSKNLPPFNRTDVLYVCVPGVTVLAVGIDQADTEELRRMVTDGSTQNILYVRNAAQLDSIHTDLADLLCGLARIPEVKKKLGKILCFVKNLVLCCCMGACLAIPFL